MSQCVHLPVSVADASFRHFPMTSSLYLKTNKVKGHLERIGGFSDIPMEPIIGMDELFHYRNKAQFPVGRNKEGKIVTGFYAWKNPQYYRKP